MTRVQELAAEASTLEPGEIEELIAELLSKIPEPEISDEWWEELHLRSERLRSGETKGIPWADVREKMFAKANGIRH